MIKNKFLVKGDTYRSYALFVECHFDVEILEITVVSIRCARTTRSLLLMNSLTPASIHLVILLSIRGLLTCATCSTLILLHLHHLHSLHLLLSLSLILHLHTLLLLLVLLSLHLLLARCVRSILLLLVELLLAILIIVALLLISLATIGILCAHVRTSVSLDLYLINH